MTDRTPIEPEGNTEIIRLRGELSEASVSRRRRIVEKIVLAALSSVPWIGGLLGAAASFPGEDRSNRADDLRTRWLEEHDRKFNALKDTLGEMQDRFDTLGEAIDERIESEEYLGLVRKSFRVWDNADTAEKRQYAANLVTNAAGTRAASDDVVRLFLDWLDNYHEAHFAVIRHIFDNPGATRYDIWTSVWGDIPREDSAEADLFKLLVRDLSTGGVIRQERDTNALGQFVRKTPARRRGPAPTVMESAFEDGKAYVLTDLGRQFVHYTLTDAVTRVGGGSPPTPSA